MNEGIVVETDARVAFTSECPKFSVQIPMSVIAEMLAMAIKHLPNEVGTCMYGHYSGSMNNVIVDGLCPLTPDSVGTPEGFSLGIEGLNEFLDDLWKASNRTKVYVGDWHSHPFGPSHPSELDLKSLESVASDEDVKCPMPFMFILGGDLVASPTVTATALSMKTGPVSLVKRGRDGIRIVFR